MDKKKILAIAGIAVLTLAPVTAYAAYDIQRDLDWSKDIVRFKGGCNDNDFSTDGHSCGRVTVFERNNDRCYVAYESRYNDVDTNPSISCVKKDNK